MLCGEPFFVDTSGKTNLLRALRLPIYIVIACLNVGVTNFVVERYSNQMNNNYPILRSTIHTTLIFVYILSINTLEIFLFQILFRRHFFSSFSYAMYDMLATKNCL